MFDGFSRWRLGPAWLLVGAAAVSAGGWLWWSATVDPRTGFLAKRSPAQWIVYPAAPDLVTHPWVELETVFRRQFVLATQPGEAELRVAGFRRYTVSINGAPVVGTNQPSRNWKEPDKYEVGHQLHAGTNEIACTVANSNGPAALWLSLEAPGAAVRSGEEWEASMAGAAWRPAHLAAMPRTAARGSPVYGRNELPQALGRQWPVLLLFTVLVGAGYWLTGKWSRLRGGAYSEERARGCSAGNKSRYRDWLLPAAVALSWIVLFVNNVGVLPPWWGYDAEGHIAYIRYLQEHWALPRASEGWEMFQPPLYYALCAAVLEVLALPVTEPGGVAVLRWLGLGIGLAHAVVVWRILALLWPDGVSRQRMGLVLAGALPPVLYLSHYITNEALAAMLVTVSVWVCLCMLKQERRSWGWHALLGLCVGAALLTKATAVLVLAPVVAALAWREWESGQGRWTQLAGRLGLTVGVCVLVAGWHYGRVWMEYGTPLVGAWDPRVGTPWWQEDGYRTSDYYLRFGQVLGQPWMSARVGFPDGIYASLWGDGLRGGASNIGYGPPWNYELMAIGYWLALVPSLAVLIGGILAVRQFVRRPAAEWLLVLGLGFLVALAVVHFSIVVPYYCTTKAFYGLAALAPFCVVGAWGLEALAGQGRFRRGVVAVVFGVWALTSCASFWIARSSATTVLAQARHLWEIGRTAEAAALLERRLEVDPQAAALRSTLVAVLTGEGKLEAARKHAEALVAADPEDGDAELGLASVLAKQAQHEPALEHARRAVELAPDNGPGYELLAGLLVSSDRCEEAIRVLREGLRVEPFSAGLRCALAAALSGSAPAEAVVQYQIALRLQPDSPAVLNNLAWLRASHPQAEIRNGTEAVRLAERACALTAYKHPMLVGTLAAAYAEAGRFDDALAMVTQARRLALEMGQTDLAVKHEEMEERFRAKQPLIENVKTLKR